MPSMDTSPEAERRHRAVLAALSGEERVALAVEMAEEAKVIAMAGIRSRHPHLTDHEVTREWFRLLHGDEIAARIT